MKTINLLKTLSSETKARIIVKLYMCNCDHGTVTDLCSDFKLKQSNISKHLMDLREKGIVEFKKEGKESHYSLNEEWRKENKDVIDALIAHSERVDNKKMRCPNC